MLPFSFIKQEFSQSQESITSQHEVIFIDTAVKDVWMIKQGLRAGITAFYLLPWEDGVLKISQVLKQFTQLSAIHLVSHGRSGELLLGKACLNPHTLKQKYGKILTQWSESLRSHADLLLYGCHVANGNLGQELLHQLHQLTQAQVAASTTTIGQAEEGGNWNLDSCIGHINTAIAFTEEMKVAYAGTFDPFAGINLVDPVVTGQIGAAKITITPNAGIQESNFGSNSFTVKNTGDKRIAAIYFDVTNALFPDTVFDPLGLAGDTVAAGLRFSNTGETGAFQPNDAETLVPFFGTGGTTGYEGMRLTFDPNVSNGFQTGETVEFGVDMDANSIVGLPQQPIDINGVDPRLNAWDIGGVSGAELINSKITVLFTDGTTAVGELQSDGSQGGAVAIASQASPNKQVTLTVNGLTPGESGTYTQANAQVQVSGQAGDVARVVLAKGFIQPFNYVAPDGTTVSLIDKFMDAPFPANNAIQFQTVDVVLTGAVQDITSLFNFGAPGGSLAFPGDDVLPIGVVASIVDPASQLPVGAVTEPIYLVHQNANSGSDLITPTATITVSDVSSSNSGQTTYSFTVAYSDNVGINTATLGNTNVVVTGANGYSTNATFITSTITNGMVKATYQIAPPGGNWNSSDNGTYTITVQAGSVTDTSGNAIAAIQKTFSVSVGNPPSTSSTIRINAGGGAYTDTVGNEWLADQYFTGGELYSVTAPIANTPSDPIYQTERFGNFSYQIPITNGIYDLNLLFAEIYWQGANDRIFDVTVEGQLIQNNLDLFAQVGSNNAYTLAVNGITVTDGVLDIGFITEVDNAKLSGLEVLPATPAIRINAGGGAYTDAAGNEWLADQYFTGGELYSVTVPIASTPSDPIYQTERFGNFSYQIPITNGIYDLNLLFAEIYWQDSNDRIFDVTVEGQLIQNNLDLFAQVGSNTAYTLAVNGITVTDGVLDIEFITEVDNAKLSGLEVFRASSPPPPETIRINVGGEAYIDTTGNQWLADQYFADGELYSSFVPIFKTEDDPIYQTERWAHQLSYQIPLANGNYLVNLHLAEIYWHDFEQRVFDVFAENTQHFDNVDIFARSKNAFFPGKDSALVLSIPIVSVTDGFLDLNLVAEIDHAKLSGLEIIALTSAQVIFQQSNNSTKVTEGGAIDSYTVVLNTQPTANVTITVGIDSQVSVNQQTLAFTPSNWNLPQTITVTAVNDTDGEGSHFSSITHQVTSNDSRYNGQFTSVLVTITDNDVVPIVFNTKTIATEIDPANGFRGATRGAWGPDGRLYVGTYSGVIQVYTLDGNYNVTAVQTIHTIANLFNNNILGLAFNPFDNMGGQPKLYVAHSQLYANGGAAFPITDLSPYSGQISILEGADFSTVTSLITGLPVSNHDHGINGIEFDNQGDLYIAVGGNTNAGISDGAIGGIPESPFTAAILKADINKPGFNGRVTYALPSDFVPPPELTFSPELSQVFGDQARVRSGVDISVYSHGLRNPFDLVLATNGLLYATDNGANDGFGDMSTSATTQERYGNTFDADTLELVTSGSYHGHPNRNRGRHPEQAHQNIYYSSEASEIPGVYAPPLAKTATSTTGIDEYRATTFGGQLRGDLFAQQWNGIVYGFNLSTDGQQVTSTVTYDFADGLDLLTGPGGAFVNIDLNENSVKVAIPNDVSAIGMTAFDIFPWRAPATGGGTFVIGGEDFDPTNTTVTIGGQIATLTSVGSTRISGIFPTLTPDPLDGFVDLVVQSGGQASIISNAFLPLV